MTRSNDSAALMQKADRALASARLLLDAGDTEGACNRAYYAMFDAARAALVNAVHSYLDGLRDAGGRTEQVT